MRWLLFFPFLLSAIEYAPWYQRILYPEGRLNTSYEGGRQTDLIHNEIALRVTPWTDLRAEFEIDFFKSRRHSYCLESLQLSGQYRLLNENIGDPLSLSTAITFILPTTRAKKDWAVFYPGAMEYEFHLSVGTTCIMEADYTDQAYVDIAYGLANEHSPWWRTRWHYDRNLFESGTLSLFLKTLAGASVRTLEFGATYTYDAFSLTLARRPIAHHFPRATIVTLEYVTPLAF